MPVYDQAMSRNDLGNGGIIPVQYAREIIKNTPKSSVLLTRGRKVTMTSKERTQPVLNLFPQAYWVNGDEGLKQTTKQKWGDLKMTAEEIAVIVPVPDAIIADSSIDLWGEITPSISESIGKLVDQAGLFGVGKPSTWPSDVFGGATKAKNVVTAGTGIDLADDIAALGELMAEQGYSINGFASQPGLQWKLRRLRDADGTPIYQSSLNGGPASGLYGLALNEVENGAWDPTKAMLIAADWTNLLVGMRQDITFKWLDQAVISDDDGKVILNLAQQDCTALRVVMRVGFQIANPINRVQENEEDRFTAAVLAPAAKGETGETGSTGATGETGATGASF